MIQLYIPIYVYILSHIIFHYGLLQDIEYSSLCYTLGPCSSILCTVVRGEQFWNAKFTIKMFSPDKVVFEETVAQPSPVSQSHTITFHPESHPGHAGGLMLTHKRKPRELPASAVSDRVSCEPVLPRAGGMQVPRRHGWPFGSEWGLFSEPQSEEGKRETSQPGPPPPLTQILSTRGNSMKIIRKDDRKAGPFG